MSIAPRDAPLLRRQWWQVPPWPPKLRSPLGRVIGAVRACEVHAAVSLCRPLPFVRAGERQWREQPTPRQREACEPLSTRVPGGVQMGRVRPQPPGTRRVLQRRAGALTRAIQCCPSSGTASQVEGTNVGASESTRGSGFTSSWGNAWRGLRRVACSCMATEARDCAAATHRHRADTGRTRGELV